MISWCSTYLHILNCSLSNLGWLLHVETVTSNVNLQIILSIFILWHLIGVSHLFVVRLLIGDHLLILRIVLLDPSYSHISVALSKWAHLLHLGFIFWKSLVVVVIEHGGSIVVLNCILSSLKLLIFYKFIMSSWILDIRAVVSSMAHKLMVLPTVCNNHLHLITAGLGVLIRSIWYLSALTIVVHEDDVTLVDSVVVWATVRSLFIASSDVTILSVTHSNGVAAHVLVLLTVEVEDVALTFVLGVSSGCSNASWLMHQVHWAIDSTHLSYLLGVTIPHVSIIIGIKLQLLSQLLLSHVKSLMMNTSLISSCS